MPTASLLKSAFIWGVGATVGGTVTQGALNLVTRTARKITKKTSA